MSKRRFTSRRRRTAVRDARLVVIATEGTKTEKQYFDALRVHHRNSKIHVEILQTTDSKSAPRQVMERLDRFKRRYSLDDHDELWLVIDVDSWEASQLSDVAAKCHQKEFYLAASNPCFELWLLLHIAPWDDYSPDQIEAFFENKRDGKRTRLEQELIDLVGEYRKSNLKTELYIPHVELAMEQAQLLDTKPDDRWTQTIGTRVYLVVESIMTSNRSRTTPL